MRLCNGSTAICVLVLGLAVALECRAASDAEAAAELRERISALIDDARCNNLVNCRVIGLGWKPCGGNEEYVAYSIWKTKAGEIRSLAAEYNFLREEMNTASGNVGSCEIVPVPAVNCVNARCVPVPSGR